MVYQLNFPTEDESIRDLLIAILSEKNFHGFEEEPGLLKAFINEEFYNKKEIQSIAKEYRIGYTLLIIEDQNWNKLWESNFQPVQVGNFVYIRADFHPANNAVTHELIITPKMSFGTGHHATTWMMIDAMSTINFNDKTVFDFGTGTGVLAILAEKLGAKKILAIDNDQWSIDNAKENSQINDCSKIEIALADIPEPHEQFDIILANINLHVLLEFLPLLAKKTSKAGNLLLSGILAGDEDQIMAACRSSGFHNFTKGEKNNWLIINCSY